MRKVLHSKFTDLMYSYNKKMSNYKIYRFCFFSTYFIDQRSDGLIDTQHMKSPRRFSEVSGDSTFAYTLPLPHSLTVLTVRAAPKRKAVDFNFALHGRQPLWGGECHWQRQTGAVMTVVKCQRRAANGCRPNTIDSGVYGPH